MRAGGAEIGIDQTADILGDGDAQLGGTGGDTFLLLCGKTDHTGPVAVAVCFVPLAVGFPAGIADGHKNSPFKEWYCYQCTNCTANSVFCQAVSNARSAESRRRRRQTNAFPIGIWLNKKVQVVDGHILNSSIELLAIWLISPKGGFMERPATTCTQLSGWAAANRIFISFGQGKQRLQEGAAELSSGAEPAKCRVKAERRTSSPPPVPEARERKRGPEPAQARSFEAREPEEAGGGRKTPPVVPVEPNGAEPEKPRSDAEPGRPEAALFPCRRQLRGGNRSSEVRNESV